MSPPGLLADPSVRPAGLEAILCKRLVLADQEQRSGALERLAAVEPLEHTPGKLTIYSDLGFMLLKAVVETSQRPGSRLILPPEFV